MVKRMLMDATHREETRVAVVSGNRLDEFDFETSTKKALKGNIYLAKVTRVEPSLQAAFVDYGGNRHGFLAFNEIHPDYYRIPISDRAALEEVARQEAEEADAAVERQGNGADPDAGDGVEVIGGDEIEELEEIRPARVRPERRYKIQEVIKKRQILLVQVTKEERGTKGAALTTYLSLAGRYCVLMPNTPRGGGISRKVTNPGDRKRLKAIMEELNIPEGIAIILRTAGVARSKAEIKRDYDYLSRLWDEIREATLKATAPALVYEEGNIIKRAIRDIYTNEISEVLVEGDEGYRAAKDFMKMLIPSHAKRVQRYKDANMPLFHRYQVESQIDTIHSPIVRLKSGGYIVIDSTEALVAIDVNSGRATRERNIEETAYKTNLEAAEEIARQLRLRDLAGLIVIDFIDMDEARNNANVERRLKEAMRSDRARIQVGRISAFGLLELSRQRLRPSLLESSTQACPRCGGTGTVRSTESTALHVLRQIEDEGIRHDGAAMAVYVPQDVDIYILNQKRRYLTEIEQRYGLSVMVFSDPSLVRPDVRIEPLEPDEAGALLAPARLEAPAETAAAEAAMADEEEEEEARGRGRRKARGRRRKDKAEVAEPTEPAEVAEADLEEREEAVAEANGAADEADARAGAKRRRRGRRGGRRRARRAQPDEAREEAAELADGEAEPVESEAEPAESEAEPAESEAEPAEGEAEPAERAAEHDDGATEPPTVTAEAEEREKAEPEEKPAKRARRGRERKRGKAAADVESEAEPADSEAAAHEEAMPESNGADEAAAGNGTSDAQTDHPHAPHEENAPETTDPQTAGEPLPGAAAEKRKRGWWRSMLE